MFQILFLLLPIAEIYSLIWLTDKIGFFNVLLFLFLKAMLALRLLAFASSPRTLNGQVNDTRALLHVPLRILGSVLLLFPGLLTDAVGIALWLPGIRHLFVWFFAKQIQSKMQNGGVRFFQFGFGPGGSTGFSNQPFGSRDFTDQHSGGMRDVTPQVIDVQAESISSELPGPSSPTKNNKTDS